MASGERRLYWVDIQGKKVHRFDPASGRNETFDLPDLVTCLAFRKAGGLLLTLRKNFAFFDPDTGKLEMLAEVEAGKTNTRFNDGRVDPQGRLWAARWETRIGKNP
ncbi:MAG TPA: SMP-30/gluconolactonase/LRE family protein [Tepidisphaeraceae bacterium]|jgi:sugar lactone lactonase YvrE|nr:SMP-30/gluconolactonase/LRE family protein [Tepidisphaeraceae bacterium]